MNIAPNGGDISVVFFEDCRHPLRVRLWDRIRRREHPMAHPIVTLTQTAVSGEALNLRYTADGRLIFDDITDR